MLARQTGHTARISNDVYPRQGSIAATAFDSPASSIISPVSTPHISAIQGNSRVITTANGSPRMEICRVSNVKLSWRPLPQSPLPQQNRTVMII